MFKKYRDARQSVAAVECRTSSHFIFVMRLLW
jgi:hypothetical protein